MSGRLHNGENTHQGIHGIHTVTVFNDRRFYSLGLWRLPSGTYTQAPPSEKHWQRSSPERLSS